MTIGENIRAERKRLNLTQRQLANMLGLAQNTIAQWESGLNQPKLEQLQKIGEVLNVSSIAFLPDGWGFLQEHNENDVEALANELSSINEERETLNNAVRVMQNTWNDFLRATAAMSNVEIQKAIMNKLIPLNKEGLWKAFEHISELTEIKRYRK